MNRSPVGPDSVDEADIDTVEMELRPDEMARLRQAAAFLDEGSASDEERVSVAKAVSNPPPPASSSDPLAATTTSLPAISLDATQRLAVLSPATLVEVAPVLAAVPAPVGMVSVAPPTRVVAPVADSSPTMKMPVLSLVPDTGSTAILPVLDANKMASLDALKPATPAPERPIAVVPFKPQAPALEPVKQQAAPTESRASYGWWIAALCALTAIIIIAWTLRAPQSRAPDPTEPAAEPTPPAASPREQPEPAKAIQPAPAAVNAPVAPDVNATAGAVGRASLAAVPAQHLASIDRPEQVIGTQAVAQPAGVSSADPAPESVKFRNPFDANEIFEFPAGTSSADARQAVAEVLLERARERRR